MRKICKGDGEETRSSIKLNTFFDTDLRTNKKISDADFKLYTLPPSLLSPPSLLTSSRVVSEMP